MIRSIFSVLLLAGLLSGAAALAQAPGNPGIVVTDASGPLRYRIGDSEPQPLVKGQAIPIGARITTGAGAHAVLTFPDGQVVALGPQSRLLIREFVYMPTDLARSRELLNLTDGSIFMVMGAIGQRDPGMIQIQVGTKVTAQSPRRARGSDAGVIVLGTATLVQVAQGRVSLFVPSSEKSFALASGARALVQSDGSVRMGLPAQVEDQAGRSAEGKIMLGRMEDLKRYLPASGRGIAFFLTTPPSDEPDEKLVAQLGPIKPIDPTLAGPTPPSVELDPNLVFPISPTITTFSGAGGGGLPCGASCN